MTFIYWIGGIKERYPYRTEYLEGRPVAALDQDLSALLMKGTVLPTSEEIKANPNPVTNQYGLCREKCTMFLKPGKGWYGDFPCGSKNPTTGLWAKTPSRITKAIVERLAKKGLQAKGPAPRREAGPSPPAPGQGGTSQETETVLDNVVDGPWIPGGVASPVVWIWAALVAVVLMTAMSWTKTEGGRTCGLVTFAMLTTAGVFLSWS